MLRTKYPLTVHRKPRFARLSGLSRLQFSVKARKPRYAFSARRGILTCLSCWIHPGRTRTCNQLLYNTSHVSAKVTLPTELRGEKYHKMPYSLFKNRCFELGQKHQETSRFDFLTLFLQRPEALNTFMCGGQDSIFTCISTSFNFPLFLQSLPTGLAGQPWLLQISIAIHKFTYSVTAA